MSACASDTASYPLIEALDGLATADVELLLHDWQLAARDDQLPPQGRWQTWLILGGRGAGKTRAGAEWVRAQATGTYPLADAPAGRIALVGETLHDVRSVMVEGESGLLAIHHPRERPRFEASKAQVVWPNGAIAQLFSAGDPDSLRGPQFAVAWADEVAKWRHAETAWSNLMLALRIGTAPRVLATTTPRPVPLLRQLLADKATVVTRPRSADNAENLSPSFLAEMTRRYAGTALGRQELDGELIEATSGALWRQDWIDAQRTSSAPPMSRVVVAVDPPVTATERSDACGIVVVGIGPDRRAYVIADRSLKGRVPTVWARAVVQAFEDFAADRVVVEVNQGGDLVPAVLAQIAPQLPIGKVRATRGKWIRAEPVAALYAEGRVSHVGHFAELEAELTGFGVDGRAGGKSPDRLDALVWALTELMLSHPAPPSVRRV